MKLIMLKGLPASGKTTYAKELAKNGYIRVNKDDLRSMLNDGKWSKHNEKFVLLVRDAIVTYALGEGKSVVVDDTNFAPIHREILSAIAKAYSAKFETKFFDTPLKECIKRDLKRQNSVGEKVIRDMFKKYLQPPAESYTPPEGKPKAIICDIDGTLAHMTGRSPYDYERVHEDYCDEVVKDIIHFYYYERDYEILIVSGREDSCKDVTKNWLDSNIIPYNKFYMRKTDDDRPDYLVKKEIFDEYIRDNYDIQLVLDDRNQVVELWRSLGLKCFQVAEGDF